MLEGGGEGAKLCHSKTVRHSSIVPLLVLQLVLPPTGGAAPSSLVVEMMPLLLLLPVVVAVVRRRRRERQVPLVKLISDARSTCRRIRSTMSSHKLSKSIYSMLLLPLLFSLMAVSAILVSRASTFYYFFVIIVDTRWCSEEEDSTTVTVAWACLQTIYRT